MSRGCTKCGCPTSLPRLCADCKRIETVDNAAKAEFDDPGYGPTPQADPNPRNDIIQHIAAAARALRRHSARNHQDRRDQLDALIRRVRHDRITQPELKNELRSHYQAVEQVQAVYGLRSAAQHADRYQPDTPTDADDDTTAEVNSGP